MFQIKTFQKNHKIEARDQRHFSFSNVSLTRSDFTFSICFCWWTYICFYYFSFQIQQFRSKLAFIWYQHARSYCSNKSTIETEVLKYTFGLRFNIDEQIGLITYRRLHTILVSLFTALSISRFLIISNCAFHGRVKKWKITARSASCIDVIESLKMTFESDLMNRQTPFESTFHFVLMTKMFVRPTIILMTDGHHNP